MRRLPAIFISHGAPTLAIEQVPAHKFLEELGIKFRDVRAVLCISAHWLTAQPSVNAVAHPGTIHDFYGFPRELYKMKYPAQGDIRLTDRVEDLLNGRDIKCYIDGDRGLDHGTWIPLSLMYPGANVPVVQLSIQGHLDPAKHLAMGRALTPLRDEGILIMGSGGAVHPLGYPGLKMSGPPDGWAVEFGDWLTRALVDGDEDSLVGYRELAPYPERAHPYPDHYMPLMAAFGAGGPGAKAAVLHSSWYYGDFGMGAYSFDS